VKLRSAQSIVCGLCQSLRQAQTDALAENVRQDSRVHLAALMAHIRVLEAAAEIP
jgi:hypothetical protein